MITYVGPQRMLQDAISRNPRLSLDELRNFHPAFRSMSIDQLGLRLARAIESLADRRGK